MEANTGKGSMLYAVAVALCLTVLLTLAAPGTAQAAPSGDTIVYVVRPGDRLADIAARYGVTVSSIVQANGLANPDVIYPGQRLNIPVGRGDGTGGSGDASSGSGSTGLRYYTVQPGDTLDKIARAHGVSASALIAANHIANPNLIWVGQRLLIPATAGPAPQPVTPNPSATPKPTSAAPVVHVVQAGETLSQIAQRYGTTVAALVAANGLGSADLIRVGMRLTIPKAGSPSQVSYAGQAARFVVSISQQRCWLYRGEVLVSQWVCSTGRPGAATRPGTYRVQSKLPKAYGSTWNIWMPYWLGIYWAGASENGIHGLPWNAKTGAQVWTGYVGTPITYGCVMLDNVNAKMLYDVAYIGMPVIIKP